MDVESPRALWVAEETTPVYTSAVHLRMHQQLEQAGLMCNGNTDSL